MMKKTTIEQEPDNLMVNEESKDILRAMGRILNSGVENAGRNVPVLPTLLVTAAGGCGVTSYGKAFSGIVDESGVFKKTGVETFLELDFPKDNEKDEKLFYASPRCVASICNRFYGTMLISLREFEGADLIESESLSRLLEFVADNKGSIYFMFHILPKFSAKNQLLARLREVTNVMEVSLDNPDIEDSYVYVVTKLLENGCTVDDTALRSLREEILPNIIARKDYTGFRTLSVFAERLNLGLVMADGGDMILRKDILEGVMADYRKEDVSGKDKSTKMGFCA